jgi:Bacterial Ig-like domain/PKD domain
MTGARWLFRSLTAALVTIAVGPVAGAIAMPPSVTITSPLSGSVSNHRTPYFSGLAEEGEGKVRLRIYAGPTAEGTVIQEMSTKLFSPPDGEWLFGPAESLEDGTYTAQATYVNPAFETATSSPVTFSVDTAPPTVTLVSPRSPSDDTRPSFTGTATDTTTVTVQIHEGRTSKGTLVSTATAAGTGTRWSSGDANPPLAVGEYTAVAVQPSSLENPAGWSEPVTFAVTPAPAPEITPAAASAPPPPVASFKWIPSAPHTGETVTLISTSTDAGAPITGFAWALLGDGAFSSGESALTTSFSAPGAHVVQLHVTDAHGLSSTAAETIAVTSPPPILMQPFPVVRIVGSDSPTGAKLSLLTVLAPVGASVRVSCHGGGCPPSSQHLVAAARARSRAGTTLITFHRFERTLRAGAVLEVRVSNDTQIGKFTRLRIRRDQLPSRTDMCLAPAGTRPIVCPE